MITLDGNTVTRAEIFWSAYGVPWVEAEIDSPETLSGQVVFSAPGAALTAAVISGGPVFGRGRYRLALGAGGWGQEIPRMSYSSDGGVKLSSVVADAASACGESVEGWASTSVGPHFVRPEGPAATALNMLAPKAWHVDDGGTTRQGTREGTVYSGGGTFTAPDPSARYVTIEADSLEGLRPGVTVEGLDGPAVDVHALIDGRKIEVRLYGSPESSRRLDAWRALFLQLFPDLPYLGLHEYRVVSQSAERLNLQSVFSSSGMPDLRRVRVRGMVGIKASHRLGSRVLVGFNMRTPYVVAFDDPESPGWDPSELVLHGDGDAVALASKVEDELGALKTAIKEAAVVAGDGGTALKTNILFSLNQPPPIGPWPLPVGSAVVKAE